MSKRTPQLRLLFEHDELFFDGFAGGGGTSEGVEWALGRSPDIAINHDAEALAMHAVNHPQTKHIQTNIRKVHYGPLVRGRRVAGGWFSPDCTYFSKARGRKPFRDRNKARRIRGLAWEVLRFALEVKTTTGHYPRVLFMENVEEIQDWCPLGHDGQPDWSKRGKNFRAWVARFRNLGAVVEWKQIRAHHHGSPTSRKRLFVVIRFDGRPVVWPAQEYGPKQKPYRMAAQGIDFSLPVPSIFLTKKEATAWGKAHGVPKPRRPLATPTLRRVARGVMRFVVNSPEPFIVSNMTPFLTEHANASSARVFPVDEPIRTMCAHPKGGHFALVAPSLMRVAHGERDKNGKKRGKGEHSLQEPLPTQPCSNEFALVAPVLVNNSELRGDRVWRADEPLRTITAAGCRTMQVVAATLVNTRNGEREGQAPRVMDITQPLNTITAQGSQGAVVAAFLAKHNGGHEATGQVLTKPADTIVCRENKALVTSHLLKMKGTCKDGQPVTDPLHTIQAHGNHYAEVRVEAHQVKDDRIPPSAYKVYAFLLKYYGTKKDGITVRGPLDTITTKERFGLVTVTVDGETYVIVDIGMRMLTPRELFNCQGFPADYVINCQVRVKVARGKNKGKWIKKWLTKQAQTRLVGNSVPPHVAAALIRANMDSSKKRRAA